MYGKCAMNEGDKMTGMSLSDRGNECTRGKCKRCMKRTYKKAHMQSGKLACITSLCGVMPS